MNIAVGGFFPGQPNENTIVPNQMEIDYIRVYEDIDPLVVLDEVVDSPHELPDLTANLTDMENGSFDEDLSGWDSYVHYDALANLSVENGEAVVNVLVEGAEFWSIQLYQGPFNFESTVSYTVEFDARSDFDRGLEVIIENGEFTTFLNDIVALTDTMTTYSLDFTMPTDEEASLKFMLGKLGDGVGLAHNVYLDNITIIQSTPSVKEVTDFSNGTFDGNLASWNQYIHFDAIAGLTVENDEAKISIQNEGGQFWSVQLYQGEFHVATGQEYLIEFDARSDIERDIQVVVDNVGYYMHLSEIASLDETMSRH